MLEACVIKAGMALWTFNLRLKALGMMASERSSRANSHLTASTVIRGCIYKLWTSKKSTGQEDGGLVFQKTMLPELELRLHTKKGEGTAGCCELLGPGILCFCSCPCRSGHNVPINPQEDNSLFSVLQLFVCAWTERCCTFKGQSLENGLSCIFQAVGNILLQKVQSQHGYTQATEHRVRAKVIYPIWSQACSLLQNHRPYW